MDTLEGFNKLKMIYPQFRTDSLSWTHRFHTRTTPFHHPKSLSSSPINSKFHTNYDIYVCEWLNIQGSLGKWAIFSVELRGFRCGTEGFSVWNWAGGGGKLRGFGCGTGRFLVWNWGVFGVELRHFGGWKGVVLLYGTDVLKWEGPVKDILCILPSASQNWIKF